MRSCAQPARKRLRRGVELFWVANGAPSQSNEAEKFGARWNVQFCDKGDVQDRVGPHGRQHIARDEDVKKKVFQDVLVLRVVVIGQLGQKLDVEGSIHINRDAGLVLQVLPPARRARLAEAERVGVLSLDPGPKSLPTLALGVVALAVELFVNRPYQVHDVRGHALVRREIGQVVRQVVLHYCSNCLRGAPKPNTP